MNEATKLHRQIMRVTNKQETPREHLERRLRQTAALGMRERHEQVKQELEAMR